MSLEELPIPAWSMDSAGSILCANRHWQVTFGFARQLSEALHPEEVDSWTQNMQAAVETARAFSCECHCLTNGQVRRFLIHAAPGSKPETWVCTATDVEQLLSSVETECASEYEKLAAANAQTEVALRLTGQQFRAFFEQGAVGLILIGLEGEILAVNPAFCRFFDYSEAELLEMSPGQLCHADDIDNLRQSYGRLRQGEIESANIEARFLRKDGDVIWLLTSISLIRDSRGHALYFTGCVQGVTGQQGRTREFS